MNEDTTLDTLRESLEEELDRNLSYLFKKSSDQENESLYTESVTELTAGFSKIENLENINSESSQALGGEVVAQVISDLVSRLNEECMPIIVPPHLHGFPDFDIIEKNSEEIKELLIHEKERLWYNPLTLAVLQCVKDSEYVRDSDDFTGPLAVLKAGLIKNEDNTNTSEVYCVLYPSYPQDNNIMVVAFDTDDILLNGFTVSHSDDDIKIKVSILYNTANIITVGV